MGSGLSLRERIAIAIADECALSIPDERDMAYDAADRVLALLAPAHTDLMVTPESIPEYTPTAHFGASLRDARVAAGVSLREAAALLGTTAVRLGEVERGVRPPAPPAPSETRACACCGEDLEGGETEYGRCLPCTSGDCPDCDPLPPYCNAEGVRLWHAHPGTSAVPTVPASECIGCIMDGAA